MDRLQGTVWVSPLPLAVLLLVVGALLQPRRSAPQPISYLGLGTGNAHKPQRTPTCQGCREDVLTGCEKTNAALCTTPCFSDRVELHLMQSLGSSILI